MWDDGPPPSQAVKDTAGQGDSCCESDPSGLGHLEEEQSSSHPFDSRICESGKEEVLQDHCHIDCLPREILLYIFSFLSVEELGRSVGQVCASWRLLARDPTLRTRLVFSFQNHVDGERIKDLLAGSPLLQTLDLESREDGQELLIHAASFCPKLRELTVKFCDGLTSSVFRALMENCYRLERLNVEGSRVCDKDCFQSIAGFINLRHLNLSHCDLLDDTGLINITKQCRSLEYLDIDGITNIHDNSVMFLTESLSHSLMYLFLDGETLTNASYESLRVCTRLKKLGVSFCERMTDRGLTGILGLKDLSWLKLRKGCQLTPAGLVSLFEDGGLSQLEYVNLGECSQLDDSVMEAMARCCPRLKHLALHWCWEVTDAGIEAIIKQCPSLQVLDLVGVVQLTGVVFSAVPTALPDLLVLDLEQCYDVDFSLLQALVSQKPSLRVCDYWGDPVVPPDNNDYCNNEYETEEETQAEPEGRGAAQASPPP